MAIPNDERGTVVSVQIAHIRPVVDPMMRRGIEDKFNPSREFVKGFGVQPVLINETDASMVTIMAGGSQVAPTAPRTGI